ncbi:MAG: hypothetical protein NTW60_03075 [Candidatus Wolfebacteria bacterium]|nr:hypothetical protein [Candidatus Wolfebacteria bacterium]
MHRQRDSAQEGVPLAEGIDRVIPKSRLKYQDENGLIFTEVLRQEYAVNRCIFSAGFVEGDNKPAVDIIYVRLEKDGVEPTTLLLRPDEAQTLAWISAGVVWSHLIRVMDKTGG